jgi:hypothetical protein
MKNSAPITSRLQDLVRLHNRAIMLEVLAKTALGLVFTLLTFGFIFWVAWFAGFLLVSSLRHAWLFAAAVTGIFLVVAIVSAWRRVDPLTGLEPLTDQQLLLTVMGQASGQFVYFSPRHASAGAALVLIGGPSSFLQALGAWTHRLRADESLMREAGSLLEGCLENCPIENVRKPAAAMLLKRLALIKTVRRGKSAVLALTEKGLKLLPRNKRGKAPTTGPSLPLELARRGWKPHNFPDSEVVVFLPPAVTASFDPEGVLLGSTTGREVQFSATLHGGFEHDPAKAFDFVSHLAEKKDRKVRDVGTYRYFSDPGDADIEATAMRFWVIGIPGAVVVVSILCNGKTPVSEPLQEVRQEMPHIVAELL